MERTQIPTLRDSSIKGLKRFIFRDVLFLPLNGAFRLVRFIY